MKKLFLSMGAILAFGIASAQTDTMRTGTDRTDRVRTQTESNRVTPEQRKDTATTKMDRDRKRKTNRTTPARTNPTTTSPTTNPSSPTPTLTTPL